LLIACCENAEVCAKIRARVKNIFLTFKKFLQIEAELIFYECRIGKKDFAKRKNNVFNKKGEQCFLFEMSFER
jgi:hypothetical protein